VKAAISSPSKITKHGYLRDDFVVDSSEGEDSDGERKRSRRFKVKPIGWDTLFETNDDKVKSDAQSEKPNSPKIGAASLLKEGKPLLFQLPEQLIPRLTDHDDDDEAETKKLALEAISNRNGFLGTLRVYDSGRVEFVHDDEVNTSSRDEDAAYELIRSEEVDGTITIKQEDGSTVVIPTAITTANSQYVPRSRQEVVCLDLNQEEAISVGTVNLQEKLIMLPKILDRVDHSNL
jgi:VCBS repeat-containing protein